MEVLCEDQTLDLASRRKIVVFKWLQTFVQDVYWCKKLLAAANEIHGGYSNIRTITARVH
jgi:hypothetical protein